MSTRRTVEFVDTSVLCNLLDIPGKNQDRLAVLEELQRKRTAGDLILPVTTVIETGNHIAQLKDGHHRRDRATRLHELLVLVIDGKAPWVLHTVEWGEGFLRQLLSGAGTKVPFTEHAMSGVGVGDLCILAERALYRQRVTGVDVLIWTLDRHLGAYS
ncbi:hypothetical protein [Sphaerisporangium corydalis]|uniref:PIN domain-containing protein n=1 Tax=Sphaerisporangium corydalis TaxID=1441875 RepID=A0ABV9EP72_9ACTN|nr:hypothetical protein [Sphaerisporangium corydalis]